MHRPECTLFGGCLGRLCRQLSVGMNVGEGEVPPNIADVAEVSEQLANDRLGLTAVWALEVAVLDERDQCVLWPADVVALGVNRRRQVGDDVRRAVESSRAPRPREGTGRAHDSPGHERGERDGEEYADRRL